MNYKFRNQVALQMHYYIFNISAVAIWEQQMSSSETENHTTQNDNLLMKIRDISQHTITQKDQQKAFLNLFRQRSPAAPSLREICTPCY